MSVSMHINGRKIGSGNPAYIIAEMSANHGQSKEKAKEIIHAMKQSGADAVKIQTYTADTITIDCRNRYFTECLAGTLWDGKSLHELYQEAYTPWEWQAELKKEAEALGMDFFSSPFDVTAVDFLETLNVPAYKVASFEIVHLPLIERIAKTGKPIIISTGMATREEIAEALSAAKNAGSGGIALLKCTSAYPAKLEDANLNTIPVMMKEFDVPVGLSDHTMGSQVPVTAVTVGASIIEKHFVMDREKDKGPDSSFSMEPREFAEMVQAVRAAEKNPASAPVSKEALGSVTIGPSVGDKKSLVFRPSLFIVKDMKQGEVLTEENVRVIRPGYGLAPRELKNVLGKTAKQNIGYGEPLLADMIL
jgi:pseudaminic acid synthase